jgi:hypothetical protein
MPVPCICLVCQAPFVMLPSRIKKGWGKYCSKSCAAQARRSRVPCICLVCHQPFVRKQGEINKWGGKYCSQQCYQQQRELPVTCTCLVCHRTFVVAPNRVHKGEGKYCSRQCYFQHRATLPYVTSRFWSQVCKTDGCWLWQGDISTRGYGRFSMGMGKILAHRFAYELTYGLILPGLFCCHHCDVRLCVRPDHLFLGTQKDNLVDMSRKGRSGAHTHPERLARGDRSGTRLHPEKVRRGEQSPTAKLTEVNVRAIRILRSMERWSYPRLATHFGVSITLVRKVIIREVWRHVV